ncbi:MAG: hypothetical protein OXU40_02920 [Nitrospira sp.]|nr:hypothetical protein [Nitrospira sp.]
MAGKRTCDEDRIALAKHVREKAKEEHPAGSEGAERLRRLRKRLKRVQRKIRGKAARIAMAAGKKSKAA